MPNCYVNSYHPLVDSLYGMKASEQFRILPFVDGSIRPEPELEHLFPSITCLCRAENFAPRLHVGDYIAYMTVRGLYRKSFKHWRLTAVLEVIKVRPNHREAANWYRGEGHRLPSNCLVAENPPFPEEQSLGLPCSRGCGSVDEWDEEYRKRAAANGTFIICKPLFCKLTWD